MPIASFIDAFNGGNIAFGNTCGENFSVESKPNQQGQVGTYKARLIDDLSISETGGPGGTVQNNQVNIYVAKAVADPAGITEGTVLLVRNIRVRLRTIHDLGDDEYMFDCIKVGLIVKV